MIPRPSTGLPSQTRARVATLCLSLVLAGCSAPPPKLTEWLDEAPGDATARLVLDGRDIVTAAVPLRPGPLPAAVRTAIDAIAPGGDTRFLGRERGKRGDGYRVEKRYREPVDHVRSVLVGKTGVVLERWHTIAIAQVPQHVLATALHAAPMIEEARIVSGPEREEYWEMLAKDRSGRTFVVRVGLDGDPLGSWRRIAAQIDAR